MRKKRLIAELGFILTAIVIPFIIFVIRFELFTRYTEANRAVKIGLIGFLVISLAVGALYRFTKFRISNLEHSITRTVLYALCGVIPTYTALGFVWVTTLYVEAIWFIFSWLAVFETIAFTVFLPAILHYDYHIKKEKRKKEMIEAIREA
jgi:hypothetical protein